MSSLSSACSYLSVPTRWKYCWFMNVTFRESAATCEVFLWKRSVFLLSWDSCVKRINLDDYSWMNIWWRWKTVLIFLSCEQTNWMMKLPKRLIELMLQRFFLTPLPLIIWFCCSCCYFVARCNKPGLSVFTFYLASVKFKTFHLLLIWTPLPLEKDLTCNFLRLGVASKSSYQGNNLYDKVLQW